MLAKVKIEIIAGLYCEFLNFLIENDIFISDINSTNFGFTAVCRAKDYKFIKRKAKSFQCKIKLLKRKGWYFKTRLLRKRKGIVIGAVLSILLMSAFNGLIWRVDVISPQKSIAEDIHRLLYQNDVYAGSIFSLEKNQAMVQKIFMQVEDVGYVTLNFSKGILTCKVDPEIKKMPYLESQFTGNITATADGVIQDLRVYQGYSKVKIGQSVSKGDLLVSAAEINRNGDLIQVLPRAYIKAYSRKVYESEVFFEKQAQVRSGTIEKKLTLKFLGKNINIKKNKTDDWENFESITEFKHLNFLGFRLPVTLETIKYYQKETITVQKDEKTAILAAKILIDTLIEGDPSMLKIEQLEYNVQKTENSVRVFCTVYGDYDITK